ncbi:hypothetical protein PR048_029639 [Dryococelus australis]|uniref:Uncharacterized protein n=1 Tax=Dryococelus australis TaxID=614101 RepID=A0ABQ9GGF7_9NEOP|nr:hypothetical protein PR048_029639 [Dryococelus australis]
MPRAMDRTPDPLVHTTFYASWRTEAQSSPSAVTADNHCAVDSCISVHTTVESSLQISGKWCREVWAARNIEVLRSDEGEASVGMKGRGKREIPEKTHRPAASPCTIPTCEHPRATPPGIEPGSPMREASSLSDDYSTAAPLRKIFLSHLPVFSRNFTTCSWRLWQKDWREARMVAESITRFTLADTSGSIANARGLFLHSPGVNKPAFFSPALATAAAKVARRSSKRYLFSPLRRIQLDSPPVMAKLVQAGCCEQRDASSASRPRAALGA